MACECGEEIKIVYIPANQLLEIARKAGDCRESIVSIKKESWLEVIVGTYNALIDSIDLVQLKLCGNQDLIVSYCPKCGMTMCGVCKKPFLADPTRDYTCVFCGGL